MIENKLTVCVARSNKKKTLLSFSLFLASILAIVTL
jgi:hypothetical protein